MLMYCTTALLSVLLCYCTTVLYYNATVLQCTVLQYAVLHYCYYTTALALALVVVSLVVSLPEIFRPVSPVVKGAVRVEVLALLTSHHTTSHNITSQ